LRPALRIIRSPLTTPTRKFRERRFLAAPDPQQTLKGAGLCALPAYCTDKACILPELAVEIATITLKIGSYLLTVPSWQEIGEADMFGRSRKHAPPRFYC
jgi:hypothetical protein